MHGAVRVLSPWLAEGATVVEGGGEVTVRPHGHLAAGRPFRIPRPLALTVPEHEADVPARLEIVAAAGTDEVRLTVLHEIGHYFGIEDAELPF